MSGEQILRKVWRPGPPGRVVRSALAEPDSTHPTVRFQVGGLADQHSCRHLFKADCLLWKFPSKEDQL